MAFHGTTDDFGQENFPNLYPKNMQDEINESYNHNKVMPRIEGQDYTLTASDKKEESVEGSDNY